MSGASPDNRTPIPSAQETGARAAEWLEQRERGPWGEDEQAALDAWLAQSFAHRTAYWRVAEAWSEAERLRVLERPAIDNNWIATVRRPLLIGIAAAFAIIAVSGLAASYFFLHPAERTYATDVGGRELITFADGTQIELNTNTVLRARMTTGQRIVWLDKGEAFFRVKHDAAHPFNVIAGAHRITDLGTEFLVRRDPGRLEVALVEGSAQFGAGGGQRQSVPLLLAPGDDVVATAQSMSVTRKASHDLANKMGWRRGVLVFKHTALSAAATEFNRYNREQIVVSDAATANLTISGTFPANDLRPFTEVVQSVFRLRVGRSGDEIVLSRQ